MKWGLVDAINLAISLLGLDEYRGVDPDALANELWKEMEAENEEMEVA